ncbi:DNA repair protein RAD51 homolog 2 isoform X1 [Eumetopias jubatus]|uniref:DNA repair protein RAD51 homolog 2 isoform X1 n=1 Tax=Eumetopias jubatus TaxID=34886 RepID=UPI00101693CD|nr:DNA repair protein RAD51 homolog 2 isoform X1 [Eumetopias jubatus]
MGSKKLRRVGLSQELCDRLNRHQIVTCQDFLCLSPLELMKMTGLSYGGVHELICMVSRACAPQMQTAYGMKMQMSSSISPAFLATTLSALDEALHGGVACGSLTEITGPPGCGKTQFCIMMSILATLPTNLGGLEGAVVYIDTESAFSAERLVEIAESRFPRYFNTEEKLLLTSSKVHLYRELSCDEVLQRIESLEEEIISKGVKLVIIDSVASVVRKEFDTQLQGNMRERNKFLAREAASLKYLAEEFSIPVILTNQITTHLSRALASQADLVSPADDLSLSEGTSGSSCVTAALGTTWSHSVNTRLTLQCLGSERRQAPIQTCCTQYGLLNEKKRTITCLVPDTASPLKQPETTLDFCEPHPTTNSQRTILIAKSPLAPFTSFAYTIKKEGLVLQGQQRP